MVDTLETISVSIYQTIAKGVSTLVVFFIDTRL